MGFCLLNNVAVAARLATTELECNKVLIIDWDVHHGNGTQDVFWEDPNVGFFSMHRFPFYPGTGRADDVDRERERERQRIYQFALARHGGSRFKNFEMRWNVLPTK